MSLLLLALLPSAHALDVRWWGVGPTVGTVAVPTRYPVLFPTLAKEEITAVRGDVEVGAKAVLYPGTSGRLYGLGTLGFGTGPFFQADLTVGYQGVLVKEQDFQLLLGGAIGAGHEKYDGADEGTVTDDRLMVNYFPVRADLNALLRDKSRAYELGLFANWHIATSQGYCIGDQSGDDCARAKGDKTVGGALYLAVGAEATVYFGDFRNKDTGSSNQKGKKGV